jgi:hypothetical protein
MYLRGETDHEGRELVIPPPLSEAQFTLVIGVALVALAIGGATLMTWAGMASGPMGVIIAVALTGAGQMFGQYRTNTTIQSTATAQATKVDGVATALVLADKNQAQADARQSNQLAEIQATGKASHTLLNSGHLAVLRANAVMAAELAAIHKTPETQDRADLAAVAVQDHERRQAIVDKDQAQARLTPLEVRVGPEPSDPTRVDPTRAKH